MLFISFSFTTYCFVFVVVLYTEPSLDAISMQSSSQNCMQVYRFSYNSGTRLAITCDDQIDVEQK